MNDEHGERLREARRYLKTSLGRLDEALRLHNTADAEDADKSNHMLHRSRLVLWIADDIIEKLLREDTP